jgi:hypothetical protein
MAAQEFKNHVRYHPLYHYIASPLITGGLIWALIRLFNAEPGDFHQSLIHVLLFIIVFILGVLVRTYALKAQDRGIRAEESLRHFMLTGKPLDSRLRIGQIVALRFASDEEFPELARQAVDRSMTGKQIKESIQQWRADHYRV